MLRGIAPAGLLGVAGFLSVASLVACGAGQLVCGGGARAVNDGCFCALGTTWDGSSCVGTPQQGACQPGAMQVEGLCFCPDGFTWADGAMSSCVALQCEGGSFASQNACVCPDGRSWVDNLCQVNCIPGAVRTDPDNCVCPEGTENQGEMFGCQATLVSGPVQEPPQQGGGQVIEQHTVIQRSTQDLTCCINGANYRCPSQDAERRCMTLDPSQCTPAGGC